MQRLQNKKRIEDARALEFIKSVTLSAISMFVPKIHINLHNSPKWFDSDIRQMSLNIKKMIQMSPYK